MAKLILHEKAFICVFDDKPSQMDGRGKISSLPFQHYHTHTPNNLSFYSPSGFLLSQEVQFLQSAQLYKYQSQPHKIRVYPDENKKKLLSNPLHSLSMVWPAQTWEWWRDRDGSVLNTATSWVGLMGCGDAPGVALLCGGDTEHTDHGQPSKLTIAQGYWHTSAINTSKSSWFLGGYFLLKNTPNTKSLVHSQLGFTVICAYILQCTVCQDLCETQKGIQC